jgi:hypothetical protein
MTGHEIDQTGHSGGTVTGTPRARALLRRDVPFVPGDTKQGDTGHNTGTVPSVPAVAGPRQKPVGSWLHIAAMNLIQDAKAGVFVEPAKLALAEKLVADLERNRALQPSQR